MNLFRLRVLRTLRDGRGRYISARATDRTATWPPAPVGDNTVSKVRRIPSDPSGPAYDSMTSKQDMSTGRPMKDGLSTPPQTSPAHSEQEGRKPIIMPALIFSDT